MWKIFTRPIRYLPAPTVREFRVRTVIDEVEGLAETLIQCSCGRSHTLLHHVPCIDPDENLCARCGDFKCSQQ